MNAALVRHHSLNKGFWFAIPYSLEKKLKIGSKVMCDTKIGRQYGEVCGIAFNCNEDTRRLIEDGAKFPLRKILYELEEIPISDITIPKEFKEHEPHPHKMYDRFVEHANNGMFGTKVMVLHDGDKYILMDGYTAYLASVLLGEPSLLCKVVKLDETD